MPRALKEGAVIHGYRLVKVNEPGALAASAVAQSPTGETVFFKQYKSPSVRTEWYRGYVAYQDELKRRVNGSALKDFTYRFIDFFTSKDNGPECYYQVFEFVSGGQDLADYLKTNPTWEKRVIFARTLMHVMKLLHDADIVHCDLKPENLFLMPAPTRHGFTLKIIDMDFSILSDKRAPWDGYEGYVGTAKYFSPEHLTPKGVPLEASDVFTCGLILYELLAKGGHPYAYDEDKRYREAVAAHAAKVPALLGGFTTAGAAEKV
ncbi:MAG: protein kinase, partial [Planctomycetes bacterium]|nr:protein kinase [Planctomycetota bacterium]